MTSVRTTIGRAMRLLPSLHRGAPDAEDEARALDALNALIADLTGWGGSYPYTDFVLEQAYELDRDQPALRLHVHCATGLAVTLAKSPREGARIEIVEALGSLAATPLAVDPNGARLEGSSDPVSVSSPGAWMFRADRGDWVKLAALGIEDELPYPDEFGRAFAAMLALELSAEAPDAPPPSAKVLRMADDGRARIAARFVPALPPLHERAIMGMPSVLSFTQGAALEAAEEA